MSEEKRKTLLRIYDSEMKRELDQNLFYKMLSTLCLVLGNIIDHPDEDKYWKIPITSQRFKNDVLDREGGKSYILTIGFRRKMLDDGKEYWIIMREEGALYIIQMARDIILEKKTIIEETVQSEKERDLLEKKKE